MEILIGSKDLCMSSGGGVIISSISAAPIVFGKAFPGRSIHERIPETRHITVEGYFLSCAAKDESRTLECERFRSALTAMTVPDADAFIKIGGRTAFLEDCRLTFKRDAPFTGDGAEHFILDAVIAGGFFYGDKTVQSPMQGATGISLPYHSEGDVSFGILDGKSQIRVNNKGDIPVGFTAELISSGAASYFFINNDVTGQRIRILKSIQANDIIRISSIRDNLCMTLIRGGNEENLTGYATFDSVLFSVPVGESVINIGGGAVYDGTLSFSEAYFWF